MSDSALTIFCRQVRNRSLENKKAIQLLHHNALTGNIMSVLRQELDSMIRCIFLLSLPDPEYREQLIHDAVDGKAWRTKDRKRKVMDRDLVELSSRLHGWTQNVYAFGCGFIHLSAFHDYSARDPLELLSAEEHHNVAHYLRYYHGVGMNQNTKFSDVAHILPAVFEKISTNLECYLRDLESGSCLKR